MIRLLQLLAVLLAIAAGSLLALRETPSRPARTDPGTRVPAASDPTSTPSPASGRPVPPRSRTGDRHPQRDDPLSVADLALIRTALDTWQPPGGQELGHHELYRRLRRDEANSELAARWLLQDRLRHRARETAPPERIVRVQLRRGSVLWVREVRDIGGPLQLELLSGIVSTHSPDEIEDRRVVRQADYFSETIDEYRARVRDALEGTAPSVLTRLVVEGLHRGEVREAERLFDRWVAMAGPRHLARADSDWAGAIEEAGRIAQIALAPSNPDDVSPRPRVAGPRVPRSLEDLERRLEDAERRQRRRLKPAERELEIEKLTLWAAWLESPEALDAPHGARTQTRERIARLLCSLLE